MKDAPSGRPCLGLAGSTLNTLHCLHFLAAEGYRVDRLITLSPELAARHEVTDYVDLGPHAAALGIGVYRPRTFGLTDPDDVGAIAAMGLDLLLVTGWQRLIPPAVLGLLPLGAYGMHGSPFGLPRGRGRSPLNWSLILGRKRFTTCLLRLGAGVDDGDCVGCLEFDINPYDTCETLHIKNQVAMNLLLRAHLPRLLRGDPPLTPQKGRPTYFPRRRPEDGAIDWHRPATAIYNLIRALTRPYPGAFTFLGDRRLFVWRAQPFDTRLPLGRHAPGTVIERLPGGQLLVATADHPLLVTQWEWQGGDGPPPPRGSTFRSVPTAVTLGQAASRYPAWVAPGQREIRPTLGQSRRGPFKTARRLPDPGPP